MSWELDHVFYATVKQDAVESALADAGSDEVQEEVAENVRAALGNPTVV